MSKPAPPMLPGLPLIGNLLDFRSDRAAMVQRGYERYGPVFGFKLGPQPVAALIGPYFIDWNQFRPQFEAEATRVEGWCAGEGWDTRVFENPRDPIYDRWCCVARRE